MYLIRYSLEYSKSLYGRYPTLEEAQEAMFEIKRRAQEQRTFSACRLAETAEIV